MQGVKCWITWSVTTVLFKPLNVVISMRAACLTSHFVTVHLPWWYGSPYKYQLFLSLSLHRAFRHHHKYNKQQGLDPLIRSVSRVTAARANASSVFQLFSFLVVCSGMISKGFGFVAFVWFCCILLNPLFCEECKRSVSHSLIPFVSWRVST